MNNVQTKALLKIENDSNKAIKTKSDLLVTFSFLRSTPIFIPSSSPKYKNKAKSERRHDSHHHHRSPDKQRKSESQIIFRWVAAAVATGSLPLLLLCFFFRRNVLLGNQLWVGFSYGVLALPSHFLIDAFVRLLTVVWFLVLVVRKRVLSGTGPDGSWWCE